MSVRSNYRMQGHFWSSMFFMPPARLDSVGQVWEVMKWFMSSVTASAIAGVDSFRSLGDMLSTPTDFLGSRLFRVCRTYFTLTVWKTGMWTDSIWDFFQWLLLYAWVVVKLFNFTVVSVAAGHLHKIVVECFCNTDWFRNNCFIFY